MLAHILHKNANSFAFVLPEHIQRGKLFALDLTENNKNLQSIDYTDTLVFHSWLWEQLKQNNCVGAVGGYLEKRTIYARSTHFDTQTEPRRVHLGVDIWAEAHTPVFAPLDAKVHSFQNNNNFGDYGPTIILEMTLENTVFYTLYGHLSINSLENLYEGKILKKGEQFAEIGNFPENGDWSPHLHFQIIADMQGKKGDFAGVCTASEQEKYAQICPNPNLILYPVKNS